MKNTPYKSSVRQKMLNRLHQDKPDRAPSSHQASPLNQQIKSALVQSYATKPLRDLFQFDALITREAVDGVNYGSSGTTDEDGDCINCERKYELRNTGNNTVRIQVPVGVTRAEAARVLRKTAEWIESCPAVLDSTARGSLIGNGVTILDRSNDTDRVGT